MKVEIVGASVDSVEKNAAFAAKFAFPFPLICDTDRKVCRAYGACDSPSASSAKRISFIIGPTGKILKTYPSVKAAEHPAQVLEDVKSILKEG